MELEELVKEVDRLQNAEYPVPDLGIMSDLTDRLKLVAKALAALRVGKPKTECRTAAYLTCVEILVRDTRRRIEGPSKPKFEKGDLVRVRRGAATMYQGCPGTVRDVLTDSGGTPTCKVFLTDSGATLDILEDALEAIEKKTEPKFKEGDPVRVKADAPDSRRGCPGIIEAVGILPSGEWNYSIKIDTHTPERVRERLVFSEEYLEADEDSGSGKESSEKIGG